MPSNYRLPLKHFEKKSITDRKLYNSNLFKVRLWPMLTVLVCLFLIGSLGYAYFNNRNNSYNDLILSKSTTSDEIYVANCKLKLTEQDLTYLWNSEECKEQYTFEITAENKENYSKISQNPDYYLKFNKKNSNLINSNLLIEPIVSKSNQYLKKNQFKNSTNNLNLDLYGPCTPKTTCELVRVVNNNVQFVKKGLLNDFLLFIDYKSMKLIEDNQDVYLEVSTSILLRYKIDLKNNSLQAL